MIPLKESKFELNNTILYAMDLQNIIIYTLRTLVQAIQAQWIIDLTKERIAPSLLGSGRALDG